ncbi:protein MAIN-LIKE 2-like [Gossypium raimondii]|uniref:protein MAIN-LIKE 2-like n=1 Tax=Gossypium raimondii TaxID=29730 RepID=UPI00063AB9A2|nr:protein MAIN-LIKE 2-like [Gossypium raimondii]
MQLQLGLPVDGSALTGSVQSADWGAICYDLFGAISDNIYGGRIEMSWLQDTFPESRNDSTEVERTRYARAYILEMIRGYLMSDLSGNLVHLRWLLKLVDFRVSDKFSLGSAVLAILYWEMCGATPPNKAKIGVHKYVSALLKAPEQTLEHLASTEQSVVVVCRDRFKV